MNYIEQAKEMYKQAQWQELEVLAEKALEQENIGSEFIYLMATANVNQNNPEKALFYIEKGLNDTNNKDKFYELKGIIIANQGNTDEALLTIGKALKENANLYQGQLLSGHLYYAKGNKEKAQHHFNMASKIEPNHSDASVSMAKIILDEGDVEKAIQILRQLETKFPNSAPVRMILGQAFIESGAYNFAEKYFEKVLETHPTFELANLYIGITKLYANQTELAEKIIYTYNEKYRNTREGMAALGLLNYKKGYYKKAAELLSKTQEKGFTPFSWQITHIECLCQLRDYKPAIAFYEKHKGKVNIVDAEYKLAELYEITGETKKALDNYKKVKENESKYFLALLGQARSQLKLNHPKDAEIACDKAIKMEAGHTDTILLLIESLLLQDKQSQALEHIEKAKSSTKTHKSTFNILHGLILDNQKQYKQAIEIFKKNPAIGEQIEFEELSEDNLKIIQKYSDEKVDERKDPIFVIGTQSTAIIKFAEWLEQNDVIVLKDRLFTSNRSDILQVMIETNHLSYYDEGRTRIQRKRYHQKAKTVNPEINESTVFADFIFMNPYHISSIKKFFPRATVILLNRDTPDIWLNQKVFGPEQIKSNKWNESVNQIISMNLNLKQIDIDKWLNNDIQTIKVLNQIFEKDLNKKIEKENNYWKQNILPKGSWKNYKEYLGQ